jgi:hypothetical protein
MIPRRIGAGLRHDRLPLGEADVSPASADAPEPRPMEERERCLVARSLCLEAEVWCIWQAGPTLPLDSCGRLFLGALRANCSAVPSCYEPVDHAPQPRSRGRVEQLARPKLFEEPG